MNSVYDLLHEIIEKLQQLKLAIDDESFLRQRTFSEAHKRMDHIEALVRALQK